MSIRELFKELDSLIYKTECNNNPATHSNWVSRPEYPKLIDGTELSKKYILENEKKDLFMYVDTDIIDELKKYIDIKNNITNDTVNYECCVCLESYIKKDLVYSTCQHNLCNDCYKKIHKKECPLCKINIKGVYYDQKYALICLGEPTKLHTFENGGYASIKILFLPKFGDDRYKIYRTIAFHDNNSEKERFTEDLLSAFNDGYRIVIQDFAKTKKWSVEIMIYDILDGLDPIKY